jgi:hypothetical protein
MDKDVARRGDGEVALPPSPDFIELGSIGDAKQLSRLPVAVSTSCGGVHANMIHTFFSARCKKEASRHD